jgi:hypothetical protein
MIEASDDPRLNELRRRLDDLNGKAARVLLFLAFAIAAIVLLWTSDLLSEVQQDLILAGMRWWVLGILPAAAGILPLKEIRENSRMWYGIVRWFKFALVWVTIACIVIGTIYLFRALLLPVPVENDNETAALRLALTVAGALFA